MAKISFPMGRSLTHSTKAQCSEILIHISTALHASEYSLYENYTIVLSNFVWDFSPWGQYFSQFCSWVMPVGDCENRLWENNKRRKFNGIHLVCREIRTKRAKQCIFMKFNLVGIDETWICDGWIFLTNKIHLIFVPVHKLLFSSSSTTHFVFIFFAEFPLKKKLCMSPMPIITIDYRIEP